MWKEAMKLLTLVVQAIIGTVDWVKSLIERHFNEFYLVGLFVSGAMILVRWGSLPHVADWVEKGVVIGAALGLITGKRTQIDVPPITPVPIAPAVIAPAVPVDTKAEGG